MKIANQLILIFVIMFISIFAEAKEPDNKTRAIYDSILKYFVEGRCYSRLDQMAVKRAISYYGSKHFEYIFRVRDFLDNNNETYQLNTSFGIYSLEGLSSTAFQEYVLIIFRGEATLYRSDNPYLIRHILQLRDNKSINIKEKDIAKLLRHHVYPYGQEQFLHRRPEIRHLDSINICEPYILR